MHISYLTTVLWLDSVPATRNESRLRNRLAGPGTHHQFQ